MEEKTNSFQDMIQNIKEGDIYTHEYNAPDIKEKSLNNLLYVLNLKLYHGKCDKGRNKSVSVVQKSPSQGQWIHMKLIRIFYAQ